MLEYVLAPLLLVFVHDSCDNDSDDDTNDPANAGGRRRLLPTSLLAANLPNWTEVLLIEFIVCTIDTGAFNLRIVFCRLLKDNADDSLKE